MPREVTAYLCIHRCGRRACCDRKSVERHEATCFFNPARRSCKTCEHEETEDGERYCGLETADGSDPLETFAIGAVGAMGSKIAVNCMYWTPDHLRFPNGVDVPPWKPLPEPDPDEFADF